MDTPDSCPPVQGNYRCHFELTLQLIGGKWKLLVIYFLSLQEVIRFSQLRQFFISVFQFIRHYANKMDQSGYDPHLFSVGANIRIVHSL